MVIKGNRIMGRAQRSIHKNATAGEAERDTKGMESGAMRWRCGMTENVVGGASRKTMAQVVTVAGSDSGGGAGIQADLKACAARGVYCTSVLTAVTAQNTRGVQAVKTGMLPSPEIVEVLHQTLSEFPVPALVVDPVMVSTSGHVLAGPSILSVFREKLLPIADIITPNVKEASALLGGMQLQTVADMRSAAKLLHDMGPRFVLVKGGDLPDSSEAIDVYFDGKEFHELHSPRIKTCNTHGTGCTLASCIAAELAKGYSMLSAVKVAKRFVETALDYSKDIGIGSGMQGPFDHFLGLKRNPQNSRRSVFHPDNLLLYAVTDSRMNKGWDRSTVDAIKAAIEGGASILQLREKEAETRDFLEVAKSCVEVCRSYGVCLLINDRVDIALACDADGVHVGESDMPAHVVRSLLGPEKVVGVSCKTPEQACQAWKDGADYIGCGGIYPTNTKSNNPTIGLDGLKAVCMGSKLPVVAIGGIGVSNAPSVMGIGVPNLKGVAVVSALFDRECVLSEAKRLRRVLEDCKSGLDNVQ